MIRVGIDPGVFISALIGSRRGAPGLVVRAFVDDRVKVVAGPLLLAELELVLRRPGFAAYVDADPQSHAAVRSAVTSLPWRDRVLLTLLYRHGASYAEIGRSMRMPIGSIGPTRRRALDRLRHHHRHVAAPAA